MLLSNIKLISVSLAFADILSQLSDSINSFLVLCILIVLISSMFWFTCILLKQYQIKLIAAQKKIARSQLEMKVEYQKLINLYEENNHAQSLDKDFSILMSDTFGLKP